jgi:GNAT superfamily N-acetyltransferase
MSLTLLHSDEVKTAEPAAYTTEQWHKAEATTFRALKQSSQLTHAKKDFIIVTALIDKKGFVFLLVLFIFIAVFAVVGYALAHDSTAQSIAVLSHFWKKEIRPCLELEELYVLPEFQRRKIGQLLFQRVQMFAHMRGYKLMYLRLYKDGANADILRVVYEKWRMQWHGTPSQEQIRQIYVGEADVIKDGIAKLICDHEGMFAWMSQSLKPGIEDMGSANRFFDRIGAKLLPYGS